MHAVVMENLEEYLSDGLGPVGQRAIESRLNICGTCREELAGLREVSQLLAGLQTGEALEPAPGFYARVMRKVGGWKAWPSFAGFCAMNFAFGRRLAVASLMT